MNFNTVLHIIQILFLIAIIIYLKVIDDSFGFIPYQVKGAIREMSPE